MRFQWDLPLDPAGVVARLPDGLEVRIRPGTASDRDELLAAFDRFSEQSRYQRFFGPMPRLREPVLERLLDLDPERQLAWGIFDPTQDSETEGESGLAIATARLFVDSDGRSAEASLAVVDDYQRRGLGRFLLELLVSTAAVQGLESIRFEVLAQNRGMRRLLEATGADAASAPGDRSIVVYTMDVPTEGVDLTAGALYHLLRAS
jgi:GNAT superfamily N-acetyltransferase